MKCRPLFPLPLAVLVLGCGCLGAAHASTLIYYDGSGSGSTVTNLGTLGSAGDGTIVKTGTGSVTFVTDGGPEGAGDAYLSLVSTASNGGWVTVPTGSLPTFQNSSWSISGFYNRTATTNDSDMLAHFGNGDGFGGEGELYINGTGGNTVLQHYPGPDVDLSVAKSVSVWRSYALTFAASGLNDGMGTLGFYLDGALANTDSTFDLTLGSPLTLTQILQWGGIGAPTNVATAVRGLTGGQDDFAFYDTVLTLSDVQGLNNHTLTPLTVVPEPASALLIGLGGLGLMWRRRAAGYASSR